MPEKVPICTPESLDIHRHSSDCLDGNGQLSCGEADFVVHVHDKNCYDENSLLWCPIPEKAAHTHGESCFEIPETHIHGESCFQKERGELICTESTESVHTHGESCYAPEKNLTCTLEAVEGHAHSEVCYSETSALICTQTETAEHWHIEGCYDESGTLTCALVEGDGHVHGEGCYEKISTLICTQVESAGHQHGENCFESVLTCTESSEPVHVHTDECYACSDVLTCTESTDPAEPVLICTKEEILLHKHTQEGCYHTDGANGSYLVCTETQILKHVHTDDCFLTVEEPADREVLSCQLEESESHQHSALCYGTWELSCGLEEHTHTESCYIQAVTSSQKELACTVKHDHTGECCQTAEAPVDPEQHTSSVDGFDPLQNAPLSVEAAAAPLELIHYIDNAVMYYRDDSNADWQPVTASTVLSGNAELKLEISYQDVLVDDLRNAGLQMTYLLPPILRAPTGSGEILDDSGNHMGTMSLENSLVTLTFDETWLNTHHSTTGNDKISGKFHVQSDIDLFMAEGNHSMDITIGNVEIRLNFENDIIAQYADVKIRKEISPKAIHNVSGDYLEYTLTVTAGQDGAPNVVVKDVFQDKSQILGYVGISAATPAGSDDGPTEAGASSGQPVQLSMVGDTMVWTIGDMVTNETRTLTYRVKLRDGYLGGEVPADLIINTAELFCGGYDREKDTSTFTPNAEADMSKVASAFTPAPDGSDGGTIQYTVWIHAMDTNTYTLTNVNIWDSLDGSLSDGPSNPTDGKYLDYLSYVEGSFRLYDGGSKGQNGNSGLTPQDGYTVIPSFQKTDGTPDEHCFSCNAGILAPGESKTLIYEVHVEPDVFPAAGNAKPRINNRAQIRVGDSANGNETSLNSVNIHVDIQEKVWSSKESGIEQSADTTDSIVGKVYTNPTDDSLTETALPDPAEFTAPAGSYKYTVTVNEAADWDVSKASLRDHLLGGFSKYIGYVRVDAYDVDASDKRTLKDTVWLSVDSKDNFFFKPESVGWGGKQSYELTYYTHVEIPDGASRVNVENEFIMTGDVGIGGRLIWMERAYVSASNIIQGSNSFSISKHSWYYEPSKVPAEDPNTGNKNPYANGALYWYIQVDGSEIPANTYLQDKTTYNPEFIYADSLVGLYTGNMGDESISSYDDLKDLLASGKLNRVDESSYYSPEIGSYKESGKIFPTMTVRLKNSIQLSEGESLFLIIKMEPHKDPADLTGTGYNTYKNKVESSYNGTNWVEWDTEPSIKLYGSNGISKQLEKVSTWNGTTETVVNPKDGTPDPDTLTGLENGTYVSWKIQLNYPGRLHGGYWVEELIPDGMKLAYVQCSGVGTGYKTAQPICVQKSPEDGWTEYRREGFLPTYYYTKGQTARWYVDGLQTGGNNHTIDFLVVCRVTDANVLLGGEEKTFQNQVKLLREGGTVIDSSSHPVSLQTHTLRKEGTYDKNAPTVFPFVITLNPLGEDLVPGADTITLLDTLSDNLKLDISSIQVTETGTDTAAEISESAVNGQNLSLTLPDQTPLTVTYSAWINAKPGDHISISNAAHWEGYSQPSDGVVAPDAFEFDISGSGSTSEYPSIKITKVDADHLSTPLEGAEFALTGSAKQPDGTFVDISWTGSTDHNGQLTFDVADGLTMAYNTVYCLRETKAPAGYVLDSTPHYFAIAKKVPVDGGTEAYPTFQENVHVHYLGSEYSYQALNHKYAPRLPETGGIGTTIFYAVGSILLAGAVALLLTKKRITAEA